LTLDALAKITPEVWLGFIEMLARARFNRLHLVLDAAPPDASQLRSLAQTGADYGLDIALGTTNDDPQLTRVIAECPAVRSLQLEKTTSAAAMDTAGHLIALEYQEGAFAPATNGAPVRWFRAFSPQGLDRPYLPASTLTLERPHSEHVVWRVNLSAMQTEFPF